MTTTLPSPLDSMMARTVNRNLLKWAAGHHIFCPRCGEIMDCKRTVHAEFQYRKPGQDWKVPDAAGVSFVGCTKCWDRDRETYTKVIASLEKRAVDSGNGKEWRLDIIDGREVFKRGRK